MNYKVTHFNKMPNYIWKILLIKSLDIYQHATLAQWLQSANNQETKYYLTIKNALQ